MEIIHKNIVRPHRTFNNCALEHIAAAFFFFRWLPSIYFGCLREWLRNLQKVPPLVASWKIIRRSTSSSSVSLHSRYPEVYFRTSGGEPVSWFTAAVVAVRVSSTAATRNPKICTFSMSLLLLARVYWSVRSTTSTVLRGIICTVGAFYLGSGPEFQRGSTRPSWWHLGWANIVRFRWTCSRTLNFFILLWMSSSVETGWWFGPYIRASTRTSWKRRAKGDQVENWWELPNCRVIGWGTLLG